mgnify:CR=1 FL=1
MTFLKRQPKVLTAAFTLAIILSSPNAAWAGPREEAKRMYDRLTGTLPDNATLNCMEAMIAGSNNPVNADCDSSKLNYDGNTADSAAKYAMENKNFYNVTLKNFITPWTNEEQDKYAPLNDYTATVIGMIRDDKPFNTLLSANILYTANGTVSPIAAVNSNQHYINLEDGGYDLADKNILKETTQTAAYGLVDSATAGIVTTRAAARAYFIDGTNRAMFRFTMINHLCNDLEQLKDITRVADRIRQDVSRSPGGDSRIFLNNCIGCHAGMDGLTGAYANYQWAYPDGGDPDTGSLSYTPGTVQAKYLINSNNFKAGHITTDDSWVNYWRAGPNYLLGWGTGAGKGNGAKSMGEELENSEAFAQCQVKKVFKAVCLRPPVDLADRNQVSAMVNTFKSDGYKMKQVFADAAVYCKGI